MEISEVDVSCKLVRSSEMYVLELYSTSTVDFWMSLISFLVLSWLEMASVAKPRQCVS